MKNLGNTITAAIALVVVASVGACDNEQARYDLIRADGKPLPYIVQADSVCLTQLMRGAVELDNGYYRIDYELRKVCPTGSTTLPPLASGGKYKREEIAIAFRDSAGSGINRGDLRGDTLVIASPTRTLRFLLQK